VGFHNIFLNQTVQVEPLSLGRPNIGQRPRPLFSSTLLPNIRPRPQPLIGLASSDLLPQIPPRSQPERVTPSVPQPGIVARRDRHRHPDHDEGCRRAEEVPLHLIGERAARPNRDEEVVVVRNRAFDGDASGNHHSTINVPGGLLI